MGSLSLWHWVIVLLVVVVVFGTKKLRNAGGDLGSAIKSFRRGMAETEEEAAKLDRESQANGSQTKTDAERETRR